MKRILLLTTGGTIASRLTDEGLAPGLDGTALPAAWGRWGTAMPSPSGISSTWIRPISSPRSGGSSPGMFLRPGTALTAW